MFGGIPEMKLSDVQRDIVKTKGNLIVSASAGTGKTHTMVAKIERELEDNHSHKVIAAITFTIKASKEIRERLKIDISECFIGTNNSFVIEEIIKPFARDVYGAEYNTEMSTDYSVKKRSFDECMEYLRSRKTICSFDDNKQNFVFQLALEIVKKSDACRRFLQARYFKIYVDEYQDCDRMMHNFFMYLCNQLNIELFVVGDDKQSIYIWRGAYPEAFRSIMKMDNFKLIKMRENHRSCIQIQNYSNLLNEDTRNLYTKIEDLSRIVFVSSTRKNWVQDILPYINLEQECALLRFKNENAKIGAEMLSSSGVDFVYVPKTPISEISTNVAWLYSAIAQYFILQKYSIYDFLNDIPEEAIGDRKIRGFMQNALSMIGNAINNNDEEKIIEHVHGIASYLNYKADDNHIRDMINTIIHEEYYPAFQMDELSHVAITFHSSKGLEYEQVIVMANDYALTKEDSIYNHYVAVTRAKNKLIIVKLCDENAWAAESYCRNIRRIFAAKELEPKDVMTIIQ